MRVCFFVLVNDGSLVLFKGDYGLFDSNVSAAASIVIDVFFISSTMTSLDWHFNCVCGNIPCSIVQMSNIENWTVKDTTSY